MKYAGLFEEQPIPLSLATRSGFTPISYIASIMRSEMALWPQPAQRVVLPPLYSITERPMRLILGAGVLGVVAILLALHRHDLVGYRARIERQPVNMADAAQPCYQFGPHIELQQGEHLRVPILLDDVYAIVLLNELVDFACEWVRLEAQIVSFALVFFAELIAALNDCPVRGSVRDDSDLRLIGRDDFRPR